MKRQFLFTICIVLGLAAALIGTRPVYAKAMSASLPLERLLASDGTLDLERGFHGSLDPTGWQMVTGSRGEPRFVPASAELQTASGAQQVLTVPGDENWDDRFGTPGPNGSVSDIAVSGNELYVGGSFTTAGNVPANNIAKWDGTSWSALGSGLNSGVSSIVVNGSDVYVGGGFTTAGGVPASGIAKWDGTSWSALGSGLSDTYYGSTVPGTAYAIAVSGSDVYVGGWFTNAGGVPAKYIAKWDGTTWSALGSGMSGGYYSSPVYSIAVSGSDVYAGGKFTIAGGVPASGIAKWDGTSWSALGSGLSDTYYGSTVSGTAYALAVSGSDVYVGGSFITAGGVLAFGIAKWDGSSWSALGGGGLVYPVMSIAVSGANVYAGEGYESGYSNYYYRIAKWDGTSWSALGSGMSGYFSQGVVSALAVSGDEVYAGGGFTNAGGVAASYIAQWNGASWSGLHSGNQNGLNGNVYAVAMSGSDVYVGGSFIAAGIVLANRIAKWDGTSWSALGSGVGTINYEADVYAIAVSGSDVYVGGWFTTAGGVPALRIAKWDGTSWSALGSGLNNAVYAISVSGSDVYVGGSFTTAGGVPANGIAKWDGTSWSALGSGLRGVEYSVVHAIAVSGSDVYVAGSFTNAGSVPANNIARWDGTSWSALGSGVSGGYSSYIRAIAVSGGNVYVGGEFTTAGGVPANNIARWDGTGWSAVRSGLNRAVYALAVSGSDVYAGGYFTTAGDIPAKGIAKWDGTSWSALGSGMSGGYYSYSSPVDAIAVSEGNVYVGGYFTFAGGKTSSYFGRYTFNTPPTASASGPYDVNEGSSVAVTASGNDPENRPLTYAWDLDNDGTFETPGQSVTFSAANLDGPNSQTITVQVTDEGGLTATAQATINVLNAAPVASFSTTSSRIIEGQSVTLSFDNQFDPSAEDVAAGLQYSYDCTNDGTFELESALDASYTCAYPSAGTFTALARIVDKDGGFTDYTATITALTPQEGIAGLREQVKALVDADTLNQGQGNALNVKLDGVIKQLEKGKTDTAINELQAFINQVNDLINTGTLSADEGPPLIDMAEAIIAALGG